jgi:hypothetical protein
MVDEHHDRCVPGKEQDERVGVSAELSHDERHPLSYQARHKGDVPRQMQSAHLTLSASHGFVAEVKNPRSEAVTRERQKEWR